VPYTKNAVNTGDRPLSVIGPLGDDGGMRLVAFHGPVRVVIGLTLEQLHELLQDIETALQVAEEHP
jgi:hypothetical protein